MPMPNDGFQWRPNDNSAQTNLRYTLEAEKWVSAVSSAQRSAQPGSVSKDLAFIGSLIQLVFCVALLVLLGVLKLVTALVRLVETRLQKNSDGNRNNVKDVEVEVEVEHEEGKEPDAVWNFSNEKQYPKGWQLIFYTDWRRLRHIWQFLYLLVFIFIILLVVLWLLSLWIPEYVHINKEVLIFAGVVSLWNAFLGVDT